MRYLPFLFLFANTLLLNAQNLDKGLMAQYLFNGTTEDNSGNKNTGQQIGGVDFSEDRFGNPCGALLFNGKDGYVEVPNSRSLNSPRKELSVGLWFRLDKGAGPIKWLTVICKSELRDELPNSPQYRFQATNQTVSINTEFTERYVKDVDYNVWHHYTVVYDGNFVRSYLDGKVFFEFPYVTKFNNNKMPLNIGRDMPGNIEHFAGSMDDLRIYNRALSAQEVSALYKDESEKTSPKPCSSTSPAIPPVANPPVATIPNAPVPVPAAPVAAPANPLTRTPPVVTIKRPNANPYTAAKRNQEITATIEHVTSSKDVIFKVNGKPTSKFKFDPITDLFSSTINLETGNNFFEIIATNKDGEATDSGSVIYQTKKQPPIITVLRPSTNPHLATDKTQKIRATIKHVTGKKDIQFYFNATKVSNFTFDRSKNLFEATVDLEEGFNLFEIQASNEDGEDEATGRIQYKPAISSTVAGVDVGEVTVIEEVEVPVDRVTLVCFDHKRSDGDIVSVLVNNQVIIDKEKLEAKEKKTLQYELSLDPGQTYTIISKAWNLGGYPTNTLTMEIYGNGTLLKKVQLESEIGKSAAIKLVYKPTKGLKGLKD